MEAVSLVVVHTVGLGKTRHANLSVRVYGITRRQYNMSLSRFDEGYSVGTDVRRPPAGRDLWLLERPLREDPLTDEQRARLLRVEPEDRGNPSRSSWA